MFGRFVCALHRARRWLVLSPPILLIALTAIGIAEMI